MNTRLSRPRLSLNLAPTPTMVLSIRSHEPLFQILPGSQKTVMVRLRYRDTVAIVVAIRSAAKTTPPPLPHAIKGPKS